MKALKVILGILGVLIAGYLVLCLVGPKQVNASSSLEMEAPASVIYQQIGDLTKWKDWGPWQRADPEMEISYGESTSGVGSSYSWTSPKSGDGNLEVTEVNPPTAMKTKLQFDGFDGYSYGSWDLEETDGKTNVTWGMTGDPTPFVFRGVMVLMGMNKKLENSFEDGLAAIKEIAEAQAAEVQTNFGGYEISVIDHPGAVYAGVRDNISWEDMASFLENGYGMTLAAMAEKEAPMAGSPSALYYVWDEENQTTDMMAAIPMGESMDLGEAVTVVEMPAGQAAMIDYYGDYEGMGAAHEAIDAFMKANGFTMKEPCVETYVTDPTTEPDTSKWLTQVTYFF